MARLFRRLTKMFFGWDWAIVRWGIWNERADYCLVRYTNVGRAYVKFLDDTCFLDESRGRSIVGDTFHMPPEAAAIERGRRAPGASDQASDAALPGPSRPAASSGGDTQA